MRKASLTKIAVFCLILFNILTNWIVINKHDMPGVNRWDYDSYMAKSIEMYKLIKKGSVVDVVEAYSIYSRYGNLYFFYAIPFMELFGISEKVILMTNSIFWVILIISTMMIGKRILSESAGLIAAVLISLMPQVFGMSRVFMIDFALTSMFALSIALSLWAWPFEKLNRCVLLGIVMGLCAALKIAGVTLLFGPLAVYSFLIVREQHIKPRLKGFLISVLTSFIVFIIFIRDYLFFLIKIGESSVKLGVPNQSIITHLKWFLSIENLGYYLKVLWNFQLMPLLGFCFIAGLTWLLFTRRINLMHKALILSMILVPYFFYTFIVPYNKDPRFFLPVALPISLIIGIWASGIKKKFFSRVIIFWCIFAAFFQFLYINTNFSIYSSPTITYFSRLQGFYTIPGSEWFYGIISPEKDLLHVGEVRGMLIQFLKDKKGVKVLNSYDSVFSMGSRHIQLNGLSASLKYCTMTGKKEYVLDEEAPDYIFVFNYSNEKRMGGFQDKANLSNKCLSLVKNLSGYSHIQTISIGEKEIVRIFKKPN